jgi:predicted nucleotidyltransferase component of viral defense system
MTAPSSFPVSLADMQQWRRDARERFMEYVILDCIAASRVLAMGLVLKGGNALRLAYGSPRGTTDLDFTADTNEVSDDAVVLRNEIDSALKRAERHFSVKAKCQRVQRNPKRLNATRPTYTIRIGYQFPTDRYYHGFEERIVSTGINIEISISDLVCEATQHAPVEGARGRILVCTLEDILAEKLRALLQQPIRNRHREQDVYDIARFTIQSARPMDRLKIAEYLKRKAAVREIEVRRSAFDDKVRSMAEFEYDTRIRRQGGDDYIPFDKAWEAVLALVNSLDLPD